jgi:oxaloacetate decarboxylase gamma subunit
METGLIGESLRLMLIGMGIVFAFLMLLVVCLRTMSWLAARLAPADLVETAPAGVAVAGEPQDDLIAVIAAAVARYRRRHLD